jgi:hypothetical protein
MIVYNRTEGMMSISIMRYVDKHTGKVFPTTTIRLDPGESAELETLGLSVDLPIEGLDNAVLS